MKGKGSKQTEKENNLKEKKIVKSEGIKNIIIRSTESQTQVYESIIQKWQIISIITSNFNI